MNPQDWLELNPVISSEVTTSRYNIESANSTLRMTSLTINGKVYFCGDWLFGYAFDKTYYSGINATIGQNPFILDASIERTFLPHRNLTLNIRAFDILNRQNIVQRVITANSIFDNQIRSVTRYVMVSLSLSLQKWHGAPTRNGKKLTRKGDGSFIY